MFTRFGSLTLKINIKKPVASLVVCCLLFGSLALGSLTLGSGTLSLILSSCSSKNNPVESLRLNNETIAPAEKKKDAHRAKGNSTYKRYCYSFLCYCDAFAIYLTRKSAVSIVGRLAIGFYVGELVAMLTGGVWNQYNGGDFLSGTWRGAGCGLGGIVAFDTFFISRKAYRKNHKSEPDSGWFFGCFDRLFDVRSIFLNRLNEEKQLINMKLMKMLDNTSIPLSKRMSVERECLFKTHKLDLVIKELEVNRHISAYEERILTMEHQRKFEMLRRDQYKQIDSLHNRLTYLSIKDNYKLKLTHLNDMCNDC